jgi:hypothetical protein
MVIDPDWFTERSMLLEFNCIPSPELWIVLRETVPENPFRDVAVIVTVDDDPAKTGPTLAGLAARVA